MGNVKKCLYIVYIHVCVCDMPMLNHLLSFSTVSTTRRRRTPSYPTVANATSRCTSRQTYAVIHRVAGWSGTIPAAAGSRPRASPTVMSMPKSFWAPLKRARSCGELRLADPLVGVDAKRGVGLLQLFPPKRRRFHALLSLGADAPFLRSARASGPRERPGVATADPRGARHWSVERTGLGMGLCTRVGLSMGLGLGLGPGLGLGTGWAWAWAWAWACACVWA